MLITSPVRKAKPDDRDEVLRICVQDHSENGKFPLSVSKLEKKVSEILDDNAGVIGIIQRQREIEAIMILQLAMFWYTDQWMLEEVLNYVRPEFRRSTNAKDMISFGKRCSDELGIPLVIGVVSNERTKPKLELYRRQLGEPVGGYFMYRRAPLVPPRAIG
jgi:hypothetical protein